MSARIATTIKASAPTMKATTGTSATQICEAAAIHVTCLNVSDRTWRPTTGLEEGLRLQWEWAAARVAAP